MRDRTIIHVRIGVTHIQVYSNLTWETHKNFYHRNIDYRDGYFSVYRFFGYIG